MRSGFTVLLGGAALVALGCAGAFLPAGAKISYHLYVEADGGIGQEICGFEPDAGVGYGTFVCVKRPLSACEKGAAISTLKSSREEFARKRGAK